MHDDSEECKTGHNVLKKARLVRYNKFQLTAV